MKKLGITCWFYAKDHFKPKALIWLAVYAVAVVGISWAIMTFGGGSTAQVAIIQESTTFVVDTNVLNDLPDVDLHFVNTVSEARQLLEDGEVEDIFVIQGTTRPEMTVITENALGGNMAVQHVLYQLLTGKHLEMMMFEHNLPTEIVMELLAPIEVTMELGDFDDFIAAEIINQVAPMLIWILIMMSGQMLANSVVSEKTSRVMEVMLGKVHPTITMVSKVLSSLLGVLLPIVAMAVGVVVAHIAGIIDVAIVLEFTNEIFSLEAILLTLIVLVLGYFCFIFLYAAAGAMANSVESLQSTLAPVTYLTMIPYFAAMLIPTGGTLMNILVYVPFMTPFVIVQRHLLGYSSMLEIVISLSGVVVFSILMLIVSARLYMNGISHNSEKVSLKDLKKMLQK